MWEPPTNDGGSPVIEYFLEHKITSEFRWSPVTTSQIINTEYVVESLKKGKEYHFRVAAANKAGTGKWSEPSSDTICAAPIGKEHTIFVNNFVKFMKLNVNSVHFI